MDGVLIDSEPAHKLAKERAFAKFGIVLPEAVYERYKGRPDETMMNEVARSIPGRKLDVDELLRIKHSEFEAIEQLAVPIEGAKALVNWAKSRLQVALATSATPRNRQAALPDGGVIPDPEGNVESDDFLDCSTKMRSAQSYPLELN
jgi:beta-phosphoglucomutase-like phosphatase (HAD superfamily)